MPSTLYVSLMVQGPARCDEVLEALKSQIDPAALAPPGTIEGFVAQPSESARPTRASYSFFLQLPDLNEGANG